MRSSVICVLIWSVGGLRTGEDEGDSKPEPAEGGMNVETDKGQITTSDTVAIFEHHEASLTTYVSNMQVIPDNIDNYLRAYLEAYKLLEDPKGYVDKPMEWWRALAGLSNSLDTAFKNLQEKLCPELSPGFNLSPVQGDESLTNRVSALEFAKAYLADRMTLVNRFAIHVDFSHVDTLLTTFSGKNINQLWVAVDTFSKSLVLMALLSTDTLKRDKGEFPAAKGTLNTLIKTLDARLNQIIKVVPEDLITAIKQIIQEKRTIAEAPHDAAIQKELLLGKKAKASIFSFL